MSLRDWTELHARLHRTLRQRQLLPAHQRLLVAVSGGQDSLCLVQLLLDLRAHWHWQLAIAHCNHRWRPDSDDNAAHVQSLAQNWQLPYYSATATDLKATEAAARKWRYEVLTQIAQAQGYSTVVTGHTQSDRAETLIYNLLRGSGMEGLQALAWQRELAPNLGLVRPLLEVTRSETEQFCQTAACQCGKTARMKIGSTPATAFAKSFCRTSGSTLTRRLIAPLVRPLSCCEQT
jgi:tRNA(Ile)-lysidine synthase